MECFKNAGTAVTATPVSNLKTTGTEFTLVLTSHAFGVSVTMLVLMQSISSHAESDPKYRFFNSSSFT